MEFWKEHTKLRAVLIALFFILGIALVIAGWKLKGELTGLGIMIVGVVCLLVALAIYNKPFDTRSR